MVTIRADRLQATEREAGSGKREAGSGKREAGSDERYTRELQLNSENEGKQAGYE
jgi:hypothetical protein